MAKKTEEQSPSYERAKMLTMGQSAPVAAPEPAPVAENDDTPAPEAE